MYCKSCGSQIDIDSTFCSYCGAQQSSHLRPNVQADLNLSFNKSQNVYSNETIFQNTLNTGRPTKYDPTYKKEEDAIAVGVFLLIIAIIFAFVGPIKFEDKEKYGEFKATAAIVSLILRICVIIWVVNIAKRQNRETFGWGVLAFLLPSIALILIATRKKLFANIQIVEGFDNEKNSKILSDKAVEFYNENKYSESIRFSQKAIELNPNNEIAKNILKKSNFTLSENNTKSVSTQLVFRETADGKLLKIISKDYQTIGAEVYIDDLPAPNGIYKYKSGTHKLIIEDGKILNRFYIVYYPNFYIEQTGEDCASVGDKVLTLDNNKVLDGDYSLGFLAGRMTVLNGEIIKF